MEKIEQKLGESLGLERAAQKAVENMSSQGLLDSDVIDKLETMKEEAKSHEEDINDLMEKLSKSEIKLSSKNIEESAKETEQKAIKMMKTYLGDKPDSSEALEFLCLAEAGEVTHYEVLSAIAKKIKNRSLTRTVNTILREEKEHLELVTTLAKQAAIQ
jgi:O6-methylguanine-DNA--protein-cysteine methyltransferase